MILKVFSQFISTSLSSPHPRLKWSKIRLALIEWLVAIVGTENGTSNEFLRNVLRFLIFQGLGITHTCCLYHYESRLIKQPSGDEEVGRIHRIERYTLRQLEELLTDAMEKWNDSSEPFIEFLEDYLLELDEIAKEEESVAQYPLSERRIGGDASRQGKRQGEDIRWMHQVLESRPRL
jgi:hypothetical protein